MLAVLKKIGKEKKGSFESSPAKMMIKRLPILVMLMAGVFSGSALAAKGETDPYGNVIDWEYDPNGLGEDSIVDDDIEEETAAPEATREYTPEEQESINAVMKQYETTAPQETGNVSVRLSEAPSEWSGDDITLSVYKGDVKEDISLLAADNWTTDTELPIGHYTVFTAVTNDGSTEFKADINSFDVTVGAPVMITLTDASEAVDEAAASEGEDASRECRVVGIVRSEDVPDESINVVLTGNDVTTTFSLTRAKSYTESQYIPAGTYTVNVAADTDSPKAEYSASEEITVSGDVTTTIDVLVSKKLMEEETAEKSEEKESKESSLVLPIVVGACAVVALAGGFVIGYRSKRKKG